MKFYKYKQVQRMTFFGSDDLNELNASSSSTKSPQTVATDGVSGLLFKDTKTLRFNVNKISNIQLSQNAKIVIESIHIPGTEIETRDRTGPVTIRMNNLNTNSYDSQNNGYSSTLLFTSDKTGEIFYNSFPEILYNFSIDQNFFKNGFIEFEITYSNTDINFFLLGVGIALHRLIERFYISFVVYDIDEQDLLLKDTPEVDYKNFGAHFNINNGRIPK